MLTQYRTVKRFGSAEVVIKKSRFIGYAKPVETEDEAIAFIESIKKEHWNATHNCSAYMIGERDEIQRASDDGEPSGTAGKPILEVIKNQGMKNVAVVVTRYFGGICLAQEAWFARIPMERSLDSRRRSPCIRYCTPRYWWKSTTHGTAKWITS